MQKDAKRSVYNRKEKFEDMIEQTMHLERTVFRLGNQIEANKQEISKQMGKKTSLLISRPDDEMTLRVTKETDMKIEFEKDKLERKIEKDLFAQVVEKEIKIVDIKKLVGLLKKHGVSQKEFKNCIEVKENLNVEKLDLLVGSGEIPITDLDGCFTTEMNESINIKKIK